MNEKLLIFNEFTLVLREIGIALNGWTRTGACCGVLYSFGGWALVFAAAGTIVILGLVVGTRWGTGAGTLVEVLLLARGTGIWTLAGTGFLVEFSLSFTVSIAASVGFCYWY